MSKLIFQKDILQNVRFAGRPRLELAGSGKPSKRPSMEEKVVPVRFPERHHQLISWIFKRAGLNIDIYKCAPLQRRLSACLRALHAENEVHARQLLEQNPDLLPKAINTLLIGVTDFLRDSSVFDELRTMVLPRLAPRPRPLRVWSAGCSNGSELYSMAILLAQVGALEGSYLLGSDCRRDAVAHARTGLYSPDNLQNIAPAERRSYFNKIGNFRQPIEPLRRHVHWKVANLEQCIEEGPWDIILWRNMAIYLKTEAINLIWQDLVSTMTSEGVIVLGRAERPPAPLPFVKVGRCIYRFRRNDDNHQYRRNLCPTIAGNQLGTEILT